MEFDGLFGTADQDERRRWRRYPLPAGVGTEIEVSGQRFKVAVHNVSLGGARFDADDDLPDILEQDILVCTEEPFVSTVRWQRQRSIGVEFDYSDAALQFVSFCIRPLVEEKGDESGSDG